MGSERNTIYSFRHEPIQTLIRQVEESEDIDNDKGQEAFHLFCEKSFSNCDGRNKPIYRKVWGKKRFIKKAKLLAHRARFDVEIQEDPHYIVVRYQFESAFLLPRSHALLGRIIKTSDDMILFQPAEGEDQMSMWIFYRTHK